MRIAIIQFPGSNCERETVLAVKRAGMTPIEFLWNESPEALAAMDGYVIVGGFSYEDRSRAGIVAALDPIMRVIAEQAALGKPVLGICNGAQILIETGLVPGLENNKVAMALAENKRMQNGKLLGTGFYNAWCHIRVSDHYQRNAFTRYLKPEDVMRVPVANGEGRFVMSDALLQEVEMQGLNVFQYCDESGAITPDFPVNPNGSMNNIAAISNKDGNVMAIMPHPERTEAGDPIFKSMHDYLKKAVFTKLAPLHYYPRYSKPTVYQPAPNAKVCVIDSLITDNQAITVQTTLQQLGFNVTVRRQVHWECRGVSEADFSRIQTTGLLFNPRKEAVCDKPVDATVSFLVRPKEDWQGMMVQQSLRDHFAIQGVDAILHGVLWHIHSKEPLSEARINDLLNTHLLQNPYAHECYRYERHGASSPS